MTTTTPCERSVVMSTLPDGNRAEVLEAMSLWGEPVIYEWDAQRPDESLVKLGELLDSNPRLMVTMALPYEKTVKAIASRARKKGFIPYVLEDKWEACAERIEPPCRFEPMALDRRGDEGPFDLIGDIHGCALEFGDLLERLGYMENGWEQGGPDEFHTSIREHEGGRRTVLLGDLVDRGPMNLAVMRMARRLEEQGGLRVLGNHDAKIGKWLNGRDVRVGPHQQPTLDEFADMTDEERADWGAWMLSAEGHYLLDGGRLVVAHAGIDEEYQGRMTGGAHSFALYGKPSECGGVDADGYPLSIDWAEEYAGAATVVHGHVVHDAPRELNNVIAIDTGCVFGGDLTALLWPERRYEAVPARKEWWKRR